MQERGTFCETCLKTHRSKQKLHIFTRNRPVVVLVCENCWRQHHPRQQRLFNQARREDLGWELEKLATFEECNVRDLVKSNAMPPTVNRWLQNGGHRIDLAAEMALKCAQFAERRAFVNRRFKNEAKNNQVQEWVRNMTGDIHQIVHVIRDRKNRRAFVTEHFPDMSRENTVCWWVTTGDGDIGEIVQAIRDRNDRQTLVALQFPIVAREFTVESWVNTGLGDINQIVQVIHRRGDRRTELRDQLAVFGLSLRADLHRTRAYITDAVGNVDDIVTERREMDWFFRCTQYEQLRYVEVSDSDRDPFYNYDHDDDHFIRPRHYIDSKLGEKLALQQWVRDEIPDGVKSLDAFVQTLNNLSRLPPPSLHAKINKLIDSKNKKFEKDAAAQKAAVKQAVSDYLARAASATPQSNRCGLSLTFQKVLRVLFS